MSDGPDGTEIPVQAFSGEDVAFAEEEIELRVRGGRGVVAQFLNMVVRGIREVDKDLQRGQATADRGWTASAIVGGAVLDDVHDAIQPGRIPGGYKAVEMAELPDYVDAEVVVLEGADDA